MTRRGPHARWRRAVETFLGEEASRGGPFALLALDASTIDDELVIEALHTRITAVEAHPQAGSADAEEVRLALHAAAAQLLDPQVRRRLVARAGEPTKPEEVGPPAPRVPAVSSTVGAIEHDLLLVIARSGGWSRAALGEVARLAGARGVAPDEIPGAINAVVRRHVLRKRPVAEGAPPEAPSRPHVAPEPRQRRAPRVLMIGMVLLSVLTATLAMIWAIGPSLRSRAPLPPPSGAGQQASAGLSDRTGGAGAAARSSPPPENAEGVRGAEPAKVSLPDSVLLPQIRAIAEGEQTRAPASEVIETVLARWLSLEPSLRAALGAAVVDAAYDTPDDSWDAMRSAMGASLAVPWRDEGALRASVAAAELTGRLSREVDLPTTRRRGVVGLASDTGLSADNGSAALAWLGSLARDLSEARSLEGDRLEWWIDATLDAEQAGPARDAVLLDLMARLSRRSGSPEPWYRDVLRRIVAEIGWRDGDRAREVFVALLADPRVSADRASVLTGALTERSAAAGIEPGMMLARGATPAVRRDLADAYRSAWGLAESGATSAIADVWLRAVNAVLDEEPAVSTTSVLATVAVLSELHLAAKLQWDGDQSGAEALLARAAAGGSTGPSSAARSPLFGSDRRATAWTVAVLTVDSPQDRLPLIERAPSSPMTPGDAEVLFELAVAGRPERVRERATVAVLARRDDPAILNAALEREPTLPRTRRTARLIEELTGATSLSVGDAGFSLRVRGALVDRLLELVGGDATGPVESAERVARAYEQLAGASAGRADAAPVYAAAESAGARADTLRAMVSDVLLPPEIGLTRLGIDERRAARLTLAADPAQRFWAEQAAGVELLAFLVAIERPSYVAVVRGVLDDFEADTRSSGHVYRQLLAAERAAVRLWGVRFGLTEGSL
ncbi:MAG: hypothetical protein AAGG07_03715 [Planctomycetota bacterium]